MEKKTFIVMGGIGDILLAYSGIKVLIDTFKEKNLKCYLFSHFNNAPDLLNRYYFEYEFIYYKDQKELDSLKDKINDIQSDPNFIGDINDYNNDLYPKIYTKYTTIGIHPFGSNFSNDFLINKRNVVSKNLSLKFVDDVIEKIYKQYSNTIFMIFGSYNESSWYFENPFYSYPTILPAFNNDINSTIFLVEKCDLVIATDSAIKSISCIMKIPTIVLVGDYQDHPRDSKFINPYIENDCLITIKFSSEEDLLNKTTQTACNAISILDNL
jgi:hypothetical protein